MKSLILTALVAFLALPLAASATKVWTDCAGGTSGNLITVTAYQRLCLDFDQTDSGDSRIFIVGTNTALVCFDPDKAAEGIATGKVNIRYCPSGAQPAANPELECIALSTVPITGIEGDAAVQDACIRVGPGTYYVEITTQTSSENARVSIQGEAD